MQKARLVLSTPFIRMYHTNKAFSLVFDGFENMTTRTVMETAGLGDTVLMECDLLQGNPTPIVQWYANNRRFNQVRSPPENEVLYLDGGRYLFIRALTVSQREQTYQCEVTNALINTRVVAPVSYTFTQEVVETESGVFGEPQDVVVSSSVFMRTEDGLRGNLVLPCSVDAIPPPTIAWFREGTEFQGGMVTADGTLVLNVMEDVEVYRNGTIFHCVATSESSSLRSRDVNVSYACEYVIRYSYRQKVTTTMVLLFTPAGTHS